MGGRKWVEQTECREEDDLTGEEEEEGWSKRHQYSGLVLHLQPRQIRGYTTVNCICRLEAQKLPVEFLIVLRAEARISG